MLRNRQAMVIGPTPPGTGVIARGDALGFGESDIADEPRFAVGRVDAIDADIDDHGAGLQPVAPHQLGTADRDDENIRAPRRSPADRGSANARR